jgi:hypothetical protein
MFEMFWWAGVGSNYRHKDFQPSAVKWLSRARRLAEVNEAKRICPRSVERCANKTQRRIGQWPVPTSRLADYIPQRQVSNGVMDPPHSPGPAQAVPHNSDVQFGHPPVVFPMHIGVAVAVGVGVAVWVEVAVAVGPESEQLQVAPSVPQDPLPAPKPTHKLLHVLSTQSGQAPASDTTHAGMVAVAVGVAVSVSVTVAVAIGGRTGPTL